jgi:hypothetical protein
MAVWPASLPLFNQWDFYQETTPDRTLRTEMEEGPSKTRSLPNWKPGRIVGTKTMTTAETVILDTFYEATLVGGSLTFDDTDPRLGTTRTYKFVGSPVYPWQAADLWSVNLELEIMP